MLQIPSLSPVKSLLSGYLFLSLIMVSFYGFGFYSDNTYFKWGPPLFFFNHEITSLSHFYCTLVMLFFHQILNSWVAETINPWIINTVQNRENNNMYYSKATTLLLINLNSFYNQVHLAFIVSSITSQISFLIPLILADFITLTYINWQYLSIKPNIIT